MELTTFHLHGIYACFAISQDLHKMTTFHLLLIVFLLPWKFKHHCKVRIMNQILEIRFLLTKYIYQISLDFIRSQVTTNIIGGVDGSCWLVKYQLARNIEATWWYPLSLNKNWQMRKLVSVCDLIFQFHTTTLWLIMCTYIHL